MRAPSGRCSSGSFQREHYYRGCARSLGPSSPGSPASCLVMADFAEASDPAAQGAPRQVPLAADAPMRREWTVVCDAPDLPAMLTAFELPGQGDVPGPGPAVRGRPGRWTRVPCATPP